MSIATKRKIVTQEVLEDYVLPEGDLQVVKVLGGRGNNLHEVETAKGSVFLASMPTRYRKNVWIKRGDYVLTQPIEEGDKVKAEIAHILYKDQIHYIQEQGLWPTEFADVNKKSAEGMIPDDMLPPSESDSEGSEEVDSDTDGFLVHNPNRPSVQFSEEEDSDSSEDELDRESQKQNGTEGEAKKCKNQSQDNDSRNGDNFPT